MSPRKPTEWLWCIMALYSTTFMSPVRSAKAPPSGPGTVEAQAKFFQDFFSVQLSPYKIEFGHVCEDPNNWEQRYEKKDFKNHRDMGKVRWGDKKGGYGEHYWDLNHAGHNNDRDNGYDSHDDGSYSDDTNDPYDEPSDHAPTYDSEYDPEKSSYDETGRSKRAHPKVKVERKYLESNDEERYTKRKNKEQQPAATHHVSTELQPPKLQHNEEQNEKAQKRQVVLVVSHKDQENKERDAINQANQFVPQRQPELSYVPYENGAGIRGHQHVEATAASVPRLFLEPSTGHVVDRATGQAYVLQPIAL